MNAGLLVCNWSMHGKVLTNSRTDLFQRMDCTRTYRNSYWFVWGPGGGIGILLTDVITISYYSWVMKKPLSCTFKCSVEHCRVIMYVTFTSSTVAPFLVSIVVGCQCAPWSTVFSPGATVITTTFVNEWERTAIPLRRPLSAEA